MYELQLRPEHAGFTRAINGAQTRVAEASAREADVVLRPLAEESVAEFVAQRQATYDRMWDGCGCKIDYYR